MIRSFLPLFFCLLPVLAVATSLPIVMPAKSSPKESLAAHEVRRYVYVRTGELLPIRTQSGKAGEAYILVARKDQPETKGLVGHAGVRMPSPKNWACGFIFRAMSCRTEEFCSPFLSST
jgi:hypothetical protein